MDENKKKHGDGFWGFVGKVCFGVAIGVFVGNKDVRDSVIGTCKKGGRSIKNVFSKNESKAPTSASDSASTSGTTQSDSGSGN